MNTSTPKTKQSGYRAANSVRKKPVPAAMSNRAKPTIWERGVGGGCSGGKKPHNWSAGAFAGSSWAGRMGAGLFCAVVLGACGHIPDFKDYTAYDPVTAHEPRVQPVSITHTVSFSGQGVTLDRVAGGDIDAFLVRQQVGQGDVMEVAIPVGGGEIARGRAERVLAYLNLKRLRAGMVINDDPKMPDDAVRLIVHRYQVTLPGCPDWTDKGGITHANQVHSNWSCANAVNLGLMVANPGDLVRGRNAGHGDGAAQVLGIQRYRQGETKPLLGAASSESPEAGTGSPTAGGEGGGGK